MEALTPGLWVKRQVIDLYHLIHLTINEKGTAHKNCETPPVVRCRPKMNL